MPGRSERATTKVFVGNLPYGYPDDSLRELFEQYGEVSECDVVGNFAFIDFVSEDEAESAVEALNGAEVKGKNIRVEISEKNRSGRSNGAGGRKEGRSTKLFVAEKPKRPISPNLRPRPPPLREDRDPMSEVRRDRTGHADHVTTSRIKRDIHEFTKNPPHGIYCIVRDVDVAKLDVLIIGPRDTPLQGGFFHFVLTFGDDYPFQPPRVKLMTTANGKVRFYCAWIEPRCICAWIEPRWTASQTLTSLLRSIQSLMAEEPDYEKMKVDVDVIRHETLRVAVCDTLMGTTTCPDDFIDLVVVPEFLRQYDYYLDCAVNRRGKTDFSEIERRLRNLHARFNADAGESSSSSTAATNATSTTSVDLGDRKVIGLLELGGPPTTLEGAQTKDVEEDESGVDGEWDLWEGESDLSEYESDLSEYEEEEEEDNDEAIP